MKVAALYDVHGMPWALEAVLAEVDADAIGRNLANLAKYLGKDFGQRRETGLHRYEVAQGFQPRSFEIAARSFAEGFDEAREAMAGLEVDSVWRSESSPIGRVHPPPASRGEKAHDAAARSQSSSNASGANRS